MKAIATTIAALLISASAMATNYNCDLLTGPNGPIMGGPGYSVVTTPTSVILVVTDGADEGAPIATVQYLMTRVPGFGPDGVEYQSGNVKAYIITTPFGGALHTSVSIVEGNMTAQCK